MSKFVKHDAGKARFDLIDPHFLLALARVMTLGAAKYSDNNWRNADCDDAISRYTAALYRHMNAIQRGELRDAESGELHTAHIAACTMFLHDFLGLLEND